MSIDRLRRLVESAPAFGTDGEWLAAALRQYLNHAHEGVTLDTCLGLTTHRGGTPWWKAQALRRRDDAIARLRDLLPVGTYRSQALAIRTEVTHFRRTRWAAVTEQPSDPIQRELHTLLGTTGGNPPSRKAIERSLNRDTKSPISCPKWRASIDQQEGNANERTCDNDTR